MIDKGKKKFKPNTGAFWKRNNSYLHIWNLFTYLQRKSSINKWGWHVEIETDTFIHIYKTNINAGINRNLQPTMYVKQIPD